MTPSCNSSAGKVETEGSVGLSGQPGQLISGPKSQGETLSQNINVESNQKDILASPQSHAHMCLYTH